MIPLKKIVSRPTPATLPSLSLPVYVRSLGHYRRPNAHKEHHKGKPKSFVQVFWTVKGEGEILIDGKRHPFKENEVAYLLPGEEHYQANKIEWEYRWFTFDGDMAANFMKAYDYPRKPFFAGKCPEDLFREIERGLLEMSPFSQRRLISVATEILAIAGRRHDDGTRESRLVKRFIELAHKHYSDPAINLNVLVNMLDVHRSTLTRIFQKRMKTSPGEYLSHLRMQRALSLLRESDMPIYEVATEVGIPDASYFCRAIKRIAGMGPKEFRKQTGA